MRKRIILSVIFATFTFLFFCTCYKEISHTITIHFGTNGNQYLGNEKNLDNWVKIKVLPSQSLYEAVDGLPPEDWINVNWMKVGNKEIKWERNPETGDYGFVSSNQNADEANRQNAFSANWNEDLRFTVDHIHNEETIGLFDEIYDVKDLYVLYKGPLTKIPVQFYFNKSCYQDGDDNPTYNGLNGIEDNIADDTPITMYCYAGMPLYLTPEDIIEYEWEKDENNKNIRVKKDSNGRPITTGRKWIQNKLITSYSKNRYSSKKVADYGFQKWVGDDDPADLNGIYYSFVDSRYSEQKLTDENIKTAGVYHFICINDNFENDGITPKDQASRYKGQHFYTNDGAFPLPELDDGSCLKLMPYYDHPTEVVRYFYFNDYRLKTDNNYYNADFSIEYRAGKKLKSPFDIYKCFYGWFDEESGTEHNKSDYDFAREIDVNPSNNSLLAEEWYLRWVDSKTHQPVNNPNCDWSTLESTESVDIRYPQRKDRANKNIKPACSPKTKSPNFGYKDKTRIIPGTVDEFFEWNYKAVKLNDNNDAIYMFDETDSSGIPLPNLRAGDAIESSSPVLKSICIRPRYTEADMFTFIFHYSVNTAFDKYEDLEKQVTVSSSVFDTFRISPASIVLDSSLKVDVLDEMKLNGFYNDREYALDANKEDLVEYGYRRLDKDNPDSSGTLYYFNKSECSRESDKEKYYTFYYKLPDGTLSDAPIGYGDPMNGVYGAYDDSDDKIIDFYPNYTTRKIKLEIDHKTTTLINNDPNDPGYDKFGFTLPTDEKSYVEITQGEKFATKANGEIADWGYGEGEYGPNGNKKAYVSWVKDKELYTDSYGYVGLDTAGNERWQFYNKSRNPEDLDNSKESYWFELKEETVDHDDCAVPVSTDDYFLVPASLKPWYVDDKASVTISFKQTPANYAEGTSPNLVTRILEIPRGSRLELDPNLYDSNEKDSAKLSKRVDNVWYTTDIAWNEDEDKNAHSYHKIDSETYAVDFTKELKYGYRDPSDHYRRWYFGDDIKYSPDNKKRYSYIVTIQDKNQDNEGYSSMQGVFDANGDPIDPDICGKLHVAYYTESNDKNLNYKIRDKVLTIEPDYKFVDDNNIRVYDGGYAPVKSYFHDGSGFSSGKGTDAFDSAFSMNFVYIPGTVKAGNTMWPHMQPKKILEDALPGAMANNEQGVCPYYRNGLLDDKFNFPDTGYDSSYGSEIKSLLVAETDVSKKFFAYSIARYVDLMYFGGLLARNGGYQGLLGYGYDDGPNSHPEVTNDMFAFIREILRSTAAERRNGNVTSNSQYHDILWNTEDQDLKKYKEICVSLGITENNSEYLRIFDKEGGLYKYPAYEFNGYTLRNGIGSEYNNDTQVLKFYNTDDLGVVNITMSDSIAFCNLLTTIYNLTNGLTGDNRLRYVYIDYSDRAQKGNNRTVDYPFAGIRTTNALYENDEQKISFNGSDVSINYSATGFRMLSFEEKDYTDKIITNEMLIVKNDSNNVLAKDKPFLINEFIYAKLKDEDFHNAEAPWSGEYTGLNRKTNYFFKRGTPYVSQGLKDTLSSDDEKVIITRTADCTDWEDSLNTTLLNIDSYFKHSIHHRGGSNLFNQNGYAHHKVASDVKYDDGYSFNDVFYTVWTEGGTSKSDPDLLSYGATAANFDKSPMETIGRICRIVVE